MADEFNVREAGQKRARWEAIADLDLGNGATADFSFWNPDAPPVTANSLDLEFQSMTAQAGLPASVLANGWFVVDNDEIGTIAIGQQGLTITSPGLAGNAHNVIGIAHALPAGNFSIMSSFCPGVTTGERGEQITGIALWEDAADDTKRIYVFGEHWAPDIQYAAFTDYNTIDAIQAEFALSGNYFRLRRNGTDYHFEWSVQGLSFATDTHVGAFELFSPIALPFVPTHFGLAFSNGPATEISTEATAGFKWLRYKGSDVGRSGVLEGARVKGFYV